MFFPTDKFDKAVKKIFSNTYKIGSIIFWDNVPTYALNNPLTDLWDHIDCPVCDESYYKLGLETHLQTHKYSPPFWVKFLKKAMKTK
jgi:hypothetical protein